MNKARNESEGTLTVTVESDEPENMNSPDSTTHKVVTLPMCPLRVLICFRVAMSYTWMF